MGFRKIRLFLRQSPGSYDYTTGNYVPGTKTTLSVSASVQPLSAIDLQVLSEGARSDGLVKVYTSVELQKGREAVGSDEAVEPDILIWKGNAYILEKDAPYQSDVINHYKYRFRLLSAVEESTVSASWVAGATMPWET